MTRGVRLGFVAMSLAAQAAGSNARVPSERAALGPHSTHLAQGVGTDSSVEGRWEVRWAQAVRNNGDGSMEVQRWGDATLELSVDGARVEGVWVTDVLERVVWTVEGTVDGATVRLEGTENDSSNPELDIVDRITITATVAGDEIEGTVRLHIRGRDRPPGARPFSGSRVES